MRVDAVQSMSLVPSLLRAIVHIDGDALILHAGQKPRVTSSSGSVALSGSGLSSEAIADVIGQLLPLESRHVLTQSGAVQHELSELSDFPGERFAVVATNQGDVLGVEIRRRASRASAVKGPDLKAEVSDAGPRRLRSEPVETPPASAAIAVAAPAPTVRSNEPSTPQWNIVAPPLVSDERDTLERLLGAAFADGASALYLASGWPPWVRVDDELHVMERTPALSPSQIDAMLSGAPESGAADAGDGFCDWTWEFPDIGRVRCSRFRDHRGPGLVLRCVPTRPFTSRELGLSHEIEELVARAEGLIVVGGPRSSGARAVIAALVDLINRTRRLYIVTVEREVSVLHEREGSFISHRECGRGQGRMLDAARAALREDPDVLVLESIQSEELLLVALDAARSGRLVICGRPGETPSGVIEGLLGLLSPTRRPVQQVALSRALLGVVVQARADGDTQGRELLLNTSEVASSIAEGRRMGPSGDPSRVG